VVQSGSCPTVLSAAAKITVTNPTDPGIVTPAYIQACDVRNSGTLTLTEYTGTIIRWESTTNDNLTGWTSITNTTNSLTYNALPTGNTYYRAIVQSPGCSPRPSAYAQIEVREPSQGGTVSADGFSGTEIELCKEDPKFAGKQQKKVDLILAGQVGEVVRWEYHKGETWDDIPDSGDPPIPNPGGIIEWTGTSLKLFREGKITQPPGNIRGRTGDLSNAKSLTETYMFRAVVRNFSCQERYSEVFTVKVDKDCCSPPVIANNYEIIYDPTDATKEWDPAKLSIKITFTAGKGDPNEHTVLWRTRGNDFNDGAPANGTNFELEKDGGEPAIDNAGYDIIVRKNCDDVPGVDPSFSLDDTITCWVCTRVIKTRINVDAVTDTSATLSWFDQSSGAYYLVEWNDGSNWVTWDTVRGQQQYTIHGLTPKTNYQFRVIKLCYFEGRWVRNFPNNPTPVADRTYDPVRFETTGTFPACDNFGLFNWAKSGGSGTGNDLGRAAATDNEGNIYVLGGFKGNAQIGSYTLSSNSNAYDYFLAKYDPFGTPIWVKRIGCGSVAEFTESGNSVAIDKEGNVIVTGRFYGSASFGNTTVASAGLGDVFVAKFRSTDGTHLWVSRAGGTLEDAGFGVEVDRDNNVFVVGKVTGSANFGTFSVSGPTTNSDLFLAKYNGQSGQPMWVRKTGNAIKDDVARNVTSDKDGNAYITGYIGGSNLQPDVNFGGVVLTNNGENENAFVARYDASGTVNWAKNMKSDYSEGNGIDIDPQGNVIFGGWFADTLKFAGKTEKSVMQTDPLVPSVDGFIAKYEGSNGIELNISTIGGTATDLITGLQVDRRGGIYITGYFNSPTITVGGTPFLTNKEGGLGFSDLFVAKYNPDFKPAKGIVGGSKENDDRSYGIALDRSGAVYIVGDYKGSAEFQNNTITATGGTWDAVIAQVSCEKLFPCSLVPRGVFVANIDNNTVAVNWTRETGVSSYDVRYRALTSQSWTVKTGIANPPYIVGNLFAGVTYEVQVRSNCAPGGAETGPSIWSNPVDFRTNTIGVCAVPTSVDVDNTFNNELIVVWDKIPGAAYYEVQWRKINTSEPWGSGRADSNMFRITNLESNVRYDIRVRSICSDRLSSVFSPVIRSTTNSGSCPIPLNINVSDVTPNSARISWTSAVTAFEYDVQWRKVGTNVWSVITTSQTFAKIDFLENNARYEYRVRSRCGATTNVSPYSDKKTFVTSPTCSLPMSINVLNVTMREITLSWDAVSGAKMYYVEYKPTNDIVFQTDSSTIAQITLKDLEPGVRYDIRLFVSCGNNNFTDYSTILNVTTDAMCMPPSLLEAYTITTTSMKVRWLGPVNAVGYKIEYKKVSEPEFVNPPIVIAVNEYNLTQLTSGTEYDICVTTICDDGKTSTRTCIVAKTLDCAPPTNFRVRTGSLTKTSVVLEWDFVPGATNYTVTYYALNQEERVITGITGNSISISNPPLNENTRYFATVKVDCGEGNSATSTLIEFTTSQTCVAPTNLDSKEDNITATQIPITWDKSSTATGYLVTWKKNNSVDPETSIDLPASSNAYVLNALSPNTEYSICIRARCGNEIAEPPLCIVRKTKDSSLGCFTPSIILPITVFRNSATIRWSFVPSASSYTISWRRFGNSQWTSTTISDPNQTTFSILNLLSCTTYIVRVRARCELGFTEWAQAQFTTVCGRDGLDSETVSTYSVYPNPNNGQFNVRFSTDTNGSAQVQLFDMQGRMVYNQAYDAQEGENNVPINIDGLSAGIYTLRFILNGDMQVGKITVVD
jgi:hypothetical protein